MDMNDLLPRLVIFASRPGELNPTIQYLGRRGWQADAVFDLREGLASIVRQKCQYAFLSLDLPGINTNKTIDLLRGFGVTCVVFCEASDGPNANKLGQYQGLALMGKVSGPAVQAKINSLILGVNRPKSDTINVQSKKTDKKKDGLIFLERNRGQKITVRKPGGPKEAPGAKVIASGSIPVGPTPAQKDPRELMATSLAHAMATLASKSPETLIGEIDEMTLLVATSGYVLIATPPTADGPASAETVCEHLLQEISPGATDITGPTGIIPLKLNDFTAWSKDLCAFTEHYQLGEQPVAVSFVEAEKFSRTQPVLLECRDPSKVGVYLEDLYPDLPIFADVYLHLQENDRYIRLIKKDGRFSWQQFQRLVTQEVSTLYIDRADIEAFRLYYAFANVARLSTKTVKKTG